MQRGPEVDDRLVRVADSYPSLGDRADTYVPGEEEGRRVSVTR
jgi:hypothetical protein